MHSDKDGLYSLKINFNRFCFVLQCVKNKQYLRERIREAKRQAADALTMPLIERLVKYSFVARYTGPINDPLSKEEEG